jgi:threonine dehydrogenase-like Zn-dependent dehydrogenase
MFYGAGDIRVEEVDKPKLETAGDVLVGVRASGICGSDLHPYRLAEPADTGQIMGHEFSGDVAELGSEVEGLKVGDRVVAVAFGGNAEYIRIPQETRSIVIPLPPEVSYEEAATIEPLANSIHIVNLADPTDEDTIVVIGAGAIGLGVLQVLKLRCSARVIVVELSERRLAMALELGAEAVINAGREDPYQRILEMTGSTTIPFIEQMPAGNVDTVCDCAGWFAEDTGTTPLQQAMLMVKQNGKVIEHSIFEKPPQINYFLPVRKGIAMLGSWGWTLEEYVQALELIRSGKVDRRPLITHEFPLDRVQEAFETQLNYEEAVKVLVKP